MRYIAIIAITLLVVVNTLPVEAQLSPSPPGVRRRRGAGTVSSVADERAREEEEHDVS